MKNVLILFLLTAGFSAGAFRVPEISTNGVTLKIEGLDQGPEGRFPLRDKRNLQCREVDASRPMALSLMISNSTAEAVSGELSVWMNDDWTVEGDRSGRVSVGAGEVKRVARTARAGKRVLPALYPVHALLKLDGGGELHPIAVFKAKTDNRAFRRAGLAPRTELAPGSYRLDHRFDRKVVVTVAGKERTLDNPDRSDEISNGSFRKAPPTGYTSGPKLVPRRGFSCHPPYAKGTGEIASDFTFSSPAGLPLKVKFFNALQHTSRGPNPGDGVTVRVYAKEAGERAFRELFARSITEDSVWYPGEVDLSRYAGKRMTLRLAVDVGPKGNSTFDGCAWGDAVVEVGSVPARPTEKDWAEREAKAFEKAAAALKGASDPARGIYRLEDGAVAYGAGFQPGGAGILDGVIAFTDGRSSVAYRGFECEVDGEAIDWLESVPDVNVEIGTDKGALKIRWDTGRACKTRDGSPRFTRLACGPGSEKAHRVYGGFGCVFEKPGKFILNGSGFTLSTRHAGIDYESGLSMVQAVDTAPIHFAVDSGNKIARMVAKNDTVFFFVPSSRGAFDAARRFAAVSGYRMSPGVPKILGKMCIDDWSSQYATEAENLRLAAKYGLGGSLYLQHNWQRWGYDYRLPEVYPPKGDVSAFMDMAAAAREGGFLFGIHDNYVDFYPDAEGFSYDHICFNEDGTPLEAWYNPRPRALSYRWLPQAIHGALKSNMALQRDGFRPNALFIDVFTASLPKDVIDRDGNFFPASRNQREWCKAFDECREVYGVPDAVMVSEAGNDMLIGHIDAVECDHFRPEKIVSDRTQFSEGERVPWHDMVTHGKMVLLAGGLGFRYSQPDWESQTGDNELHGYGSDDYFCTTVIGGRSPMAGGGTFGNISVKTHWLLNDVCAEFAKGEFLRFDFLDGVHRQRSRFSTGEAVINRAGEEWKYGDTVLPRYGFKARAANGMEAGVVSVDGVRCAYAKRPGRWFVDARSPSGDGIRAAVSSSAKGMTVLSGTSARLDVNWRTHYPVEDKYRTFCHIVPVTNVRAIAFHAGLRGITPEVRKTQADHKGVHVEINLPADAPAGEYSVRYGMYDPKGRRLRISGRCDDNFRIRGGILTVERKGGKISKLSWRHDEITNRDRELGINSTRKPVDFGGIVTCGSFRFEFPESGFKASLKRLLGRGKKEWKIVPLPGALGFKAEIDLSRFGGKGVGIKSVEAVDAKAFAAAPVWRQEGDRLFLELDANAFAYRLVAE